MYDFVDLECGLSLCLYIASLRSICILHFFGEVADRCQLYPVDLMASLSSSTSLQIFCLPNLPISDRGV